MSGKRSKKLIILAGVLAAACLVTLALLGMEQKQEAIRTSGEVILEIPTESVTALRWTAAGNPEIALHRSGDSWIYDKDAAFPVDGRKIEQMLEQFESFAAAFIIEDPEELSAYGLRDPSAVIDLTLGEETREIQLGSFSAMDAQRYVSIGDGNVYLVQRDPMTDFDIALSDLILHDNIPRFDQLETLDIQGSESMTITYCEDGGPSLREEDHYFTQRQGTEVPLDNGLVEGFLQDLSWTTLHSYVTYDATDEDLERYGLQTPQLTLNVAYTDENEAGQTFTIHISRDPEEAAAAGDEDEAEEITAFARVGESPIIYQISGEDYENLMACTYNDLRHHEVLPTEYSSIAQIEVNLDSDSCVFTLDTTDGQPVISYLGEEFDAADVQNALTALTAQEFTETVSHDQTEISMELTLRGKEAPTVRISLDRFDGTRCLAIVDGQPFALVDRGQVIDLIEAIHTIVLDTQTVSVPD